MLAADRNQTSIAKQPSQLEILTEHMGCVPTEFVDDIINSVNELLYEAMKGLKVYLETKLGDHEDVETALAQVETLFENSVDKHFDKFEMYVLRNILCVPQEVNVVLPHYEYLHSVEPCQTTEQEHKTEETLDMELEQLRHEILAEKYFKYRIHAEIEKTRQRYTALNDISEKLSKLLPSDQATSLLDAVENVSTLVTHLRELMSLTKKRTDDGMFKEIMLKVDDRSQYINRAIQTYLENSKKSQDTAAENVPTFAEYRNEYKTFAQVFKADPIQNAFFKTATNKE